MQPGVECHNIELQEDRYMSKKDSVVVDLITCVFPSTNVYITTTAEQCTVNRVQRQYF